jgi:ankyrin repeat protein
MNLNLKEDLLLVRDVSGRTAGHLAAEMGNAETLKKIFDWAKEEKLDIEVDLLLAKDRNGQTPLELLKDCCFISEDMKAQALQQWNCYLHDA